MAPSAADEPLQIILLPPVLLDGKAFTVTVTLFDLVQPVAVIVSVNVYVVVTVGETDGLETEEVKPAGLEVQLYVLPVNAAAPTVIELPLQSAALLPAFAAGNGLTVMTTVLLLIQPVAVTVSVSV